MMGDLLAEARRPTRILGAIFGIALAGHFGAPVEKVIPAPVKSGYVAGREWQQSNAAKLGCASKHIAALSSSHEARLTDAERLCKRLEPTIER